MSTLMRASQRMYRILVRLYPVNHQREFGQEMQYVFARSLRDARATQGNRGIVRLWAHTITDTAISLIRQHIEYKKGSSTMNTNTKPSLIMQNKIFGWIIGGIAAVLSIPLIAMQFSSDVRWDVFDFIIMGALMFTLASLFVCTARKLRKPLHRVLAAVGFLLLLLYIWAELAVGVFTHLGS